MTIQEQFACTTCDQIFHNKMKLTQHFLKHSQENQVDFLKPGHLWTENEKLKYFDTLCFETLEMETRVNDYEKKCSLLEYKLRQFPVQPTFDKSVRPSDRKGQKTERKARHLGRDGSRGLYEDLPGDLSLPQGWSSARRNMSKAAWGEKIQTTVYWAPDGRFCKSRRDALNYMSELGSTDEDVSRMVAGLEQDGWKTEDYLPLGWRSKKNGKDRNYRFITPDFQMCRNQKKALKVIMTGYSKEEVWRFVSSVWLKEEEVGKVKWLEDPSLPAGWMMGGREATKSTRTLVILTSQGTVLTAGRNFREMVSKEVDCSDKEKAAVCDLVERQQHKLELDAQPGLNWEPLLPEGWMKLPSQPTYLSPDGFIFKTKKAMVEFIKMKNGDDSGSTIQEKKEKKTREWLEDSTIPKGWRSYNTGDGIHYLDDHGNTFRGRIEAIKSLQQTKEEEDEELIRMISGLEVDGWKEKMYLPQGWRMRRFKRMENVKTEKIQKKDYRVLYLTENMEIFKTLHEVLAKMKKDGFTEEDISILKGHARTEDPELPKGWMYKLNLAGYKTYINSEGIYFGSLTQVARHMFIKQFPQEELQMAINALSNQGWEKSDYLPHGWMLRRVSYSPGIYYLSDQFTMLSKRSEVEELLGAVDFNTLDLFRLNYETIISRPIREFKNETQTLSVPISDMKWEEDSTLPEGWMISPYRLMKGKNAGAQHFRFLHSTSGRVFGNRSQAMTFLSSLPPCTCCTSSSSSSLSCREQQLAKMRQGFLNTGWQDSPHLPRNWLMKDGKKVTYLTPTGVKIVIREQIINFMRQNGCSEEEIDTFQENCSTFKYQCDEFLPQGWKRGLVSIGNKKKIPRWLSPQGRLFNSRATAILSLITNSTTVSQMDLWRRGFSSDGFSLDSCLPPGWMRKWRPSSGWMWVSPQFTVLKNQKALVQHIQASMGPESANVEELVNLLISNPPGKRTNKSSAFSIGKGSFEFAWQEDSLLPEGWKLAYYTPALATMAGVASDKFIKLLSPAGKCLSGRTIALRHMVAQKYSQKSIEKMQSGLWKDGYDQSPFLPKGWMVRKMAGEDEKISYKFLSPSFDTIKSVKKLLVYMKNKGHGDEYIKAVIYNFKKERKLPVRKSRLLKEQVEMLAGGKLKRGCGVNLRQQEVRRGVKIHR